MLDNLFDSIKGEIISGITEKAGITTDQAEKVIPMAKETMSDQLTSAVKGGQLDSIMNLFSQGENAGNSIFEGMKSQLISNIVGKLGLPESVAGIVAGTGLDNIVNKVTGMAAGGDGSLDQSKLLSTLGMDSGGLGDIAKGLFKDKLGGLGNLFG